MESFPDLGEVLGLFAVFLGALAVLYRRYVFSLFDPLLAFLVASAFACVLLVETVASPFERAWFLAAHLAFFLGFTRGARRTDPAAPASTRPDPDAVARLERLVLVSFAILLLANLFVLASVGAPLLSEDPSVSKVKVFEGGLGLARRINWGLGVFTLCGTLFLIVTSPRRKLFTSLVLVQLVLAVLGGGKGSLLAYLFAVAYLVHIPALREDPTARRLARLQPAALGLAVVGAAAVLIRERGDLLGAAAGLVTRLLYSGDSILYYYQPEVQAFFSRLGPLDYLSSDLNPILGFLRLVPYQAPLGYQMVDFTLGSTEWLPTILGPNSPFYIKGHVYFGVVGGLAYAAAVGLVVGYLRRRFFAARLEDPLRFVVLFAITVLAFDLPVESGLFVSRVFDMMVVLVPAALVARAVRPEVKGAPDAHVA